MLFRYIHHTTNYKPLTGDLNNMAKTSDYKVDPITGKGKLVAKGNPHKKQKDYHYGPKPTMGHEGQNLPNPKLVRGA